MVRFADRRGRAGGGRHHRHPAARARASSSSASGSGPGRRSTSTSCRTGCSCCCRTRPSSSSTPACCRARHPGRRGSRWRSRSARKRFSVEARAANDQSPSIGANDVGLTFTWFNVLGRNDPLVLTGDLTEGLREASFYYSVPLTARDLRFHIGGQISSADVVDDDVEDLNIESSAKQLTVGFGMPIIDTTANRVGLDLSLQPRAQPHLPAQRAVLLLARHRRRPQRRLGAAVHAGLAEPRPAPGDLRWPRPSISACRSSAPPTIVLRAARRRVLLLVRPGPAGAPAVHRPRPGGRARPGADRDRPAAGQPAIFARRHRHGARLLRQRGGARQRLRGRHRVPLPLARPAGTASGIRGPDDMSLELVPFFDYGYGVNHSRQPRGRRFRHAGQPRPGPALDLAAPAAGRGLLGQPLQQPRRRRPTTCCSTPASISGSRPSCTERRADRIASENKIVQALNESRITPQEARALQDWAENSYRTHRVAKAAMGER